MSLLEFMFGNWETPSYFANLEILPAKSESKYFLQIFYTSKEKIALFQDPTEKKTRPRMMGNAVCWENGDNEIIADAESISVYPESNDDFETTIKINDLMAYLLYIESKQIYSHWRKEEFLEFAKSRYNKDYFDLYYGKYADSDVYRKNNFKDVQLGFSDGEGVKKFYVENERKLRSRLIEKGSFRDYNVIFHPNVKIFFNVQRLESSDTVV